MQSSEIHQQTVDFFYNPCTTILREYKKNNEMSILRIDKSIVNIF